MSSPTRALSIAEHFSGFGSDIANLRKRLRALPATETHDTFPPYGAAYRRRFGIENEQALDLFYQTVSMKSVGNLTEFVREHMLEAFPVEPRIAALIGHFDDLNRAHDAVLKAKDQIGSADAADRRLRRPCRLSPPRWTAACLPRRAASLVRRPES